MPSARVSDYSADPETDNSNNSEIGPDPFEPSDFQRAIFEWFRSGSGHLVVTAGPGSGKTATILRAIDYAPEDSILLTAFMKRMQQELASRVENPRAKVRTLNSVGYQALLASQLPRAWTRMCERPWDRQDHLAGLVTGGMPYGAKRLVAQLVTKAREIRPLVHDEADPVAALCALAVDFDILPMPGEGLPLANVAEATLRAMQLAHEREPSETGIDFADQLFLPLRKGLLRPTYDMVVVDEAQDMTAAQLLLARAVCQPYGRIVIVGDPKQSIFGFRGTDSHGMRRLQQELQAEELPLSISYRLPKSHVALAQKYVPELQAAPGAIEGTVDSVASITDIVQTAEPGDFVLSRKNAPLARVALAMLRAQKRCKIQGRDIGNGLKSLVRQLAKGGAASSLPEFLKRLVAWEGKQCERLEAMGREDRCDAIRDQAQTLRHLGLDATSVPALLARIDYLFTDDGTGSVVCSTVHKAKGLEAGRVFVLRHTFFIPVGCECGHRHPVGPCKRCACMTYVLDADRQQEEVNIWFVATTRAKRRLTFCEEKM